MEALLPLSQLLPLASQISPFYEPANILVTGVQHSYVLILFSFRSNLLLHKVTGGAGFIASGVVTHILAQYPHYKVWCVGRISH